MIANPDFVFGERRHRQFFEAKIVDVRPLRGAMRARYGGRCQSRELFLIGRDGA
jgi:hypothetical protein